MKSRTYRLPDKLIDSIEAEARRRKISPTEVVRERLSVQRDYSLSGPSWNDSLAGFVGGLDGLPHGGDSRNIKAALKASGYGRNRSR